MVTGLEELDYCSTDVSCIYVEISMHILCTYIIIPTGEGTSGELAKVQFAQIVEGSIVYDDGKSEHDVFGGNY